MGLLSVMMVDTTVAPAIRAGLAATELDEAARTAGFKDLRHIGLEKVRAGLTSLEELARILPS
jgi:type II secretory ATPase GspE/PulE/Tfp pilus assembly ATPase PilB-like protein